ncbi:MAG: hypothetical protein IKO36_12165 [Bacteroidaceae bacterium]|nr:hypothetical protein [Bacteroidaceae bacterium]
MIVPKIKGNSGCDLNIVEDNNFLRIIKTCKSSYLERLHKQYVKQLNEYVYLHKNKMFIKVPDIKWVNDSMNMSYIYGKSFIDFFERSNINDIKYITDEIISYIDDEINRSSLEYINKGILVDKVNSTFANTKNNAFYKSSDDNLFYKAIEKLNEFPEKIKLPIGQCHGDLTFSNMIFNNSGIWIIDFLDSFVETPLQDIVKLRQDTLYKWSTNMTENSYNKVRINTVFKYIDEQITKYFSKYDWFVSYYNIFQYINILRILPYAKTEDIHEFLVNVLIKIKL